MSVVVEGGEGGMDGRVLEGLGLEIPYTVDDANSKGRYISHLHTVLNCGKVENALFGVSDSILLTRTRTPDMSMLQSSYVRHLPRKIRPVIYVTCLRYLPKVGR